MDLIRQWRDAKAAEMGTPPYAVLTDASLAALVEQPPSSLLALAQVPGLTNTKVNDFGAELLAELQRP